MSRSLIDNTLAELINQAAKGDRITKGHLRRFLADPDRVLPEDSLKAEERLLFLLPKEHLGFERAVYEDGKLMYVTPWDGGWRIALNGKIVVGTHLSIYGDDGTVVGAVEDDGPTFAEGRLLCAYFGPDERWWMRWGDGMDGSAYPLRGKPAMQPIVIAGKLACVTRNDDGRFYLQHGDDSYGPYEEADKDSLCAVVNCGIGYAAREGGKMSVYVNGHRVNFPDLGADRWDDIRNLQCRKDPPEGGIFPDLFSFIAVYGGEGRECTDQVVVHGRFQGHAEPEISDLVIEEEPSGPVRMLYMRRGPDSLDVCGDDGVYRSYDWKGARELTLCGGKPSFIATDAGCEKAVWARRGEYGGLYHEESKPYDAVIGLSVIEGKPLFIARRGDSVNGKYFVVYGETESGVKVSDHDDIRDYAVVEGQVLQTVYDDESGDDRVHFGAKKSRPYERVFGFEVKEDGRVEFCAQRGRRIVICSFDPKR